MARLTVSQLIKRLQESPNMNAEVRLGGSGADLVGGAVYIAATDICTITAHGLQAGDKVRVLSIAGGTGLSAATDYFVSPTNLAANTFSLTATEGGAPINVTADTTAIAMALVSVRGATDPAKATPTPDVPAAQLSFTPTPGVLNLA